MQPPVHAMACVCVADTIFSLLSCVVFPNSIESKSSAIEMGEAEN